MPTWSRKLGRGSPVGLVLSGGVALCVLATVANGPKTSPQTERPKSLHRTLPRVGDSAGMSHGRARPVSLA